MPESDGATLQNYSFLSK